MKKLPHRMIWAFGLGYFAFYAPYSGLTKALTSGLWPGVAPGLTGLELLPATIVGTALAVLLLVTVLGWWRHLGRVSPLVVVSGFGTALIIGCTTLAYTFEGVSIVLALLLMRGGVLIMAPLMDFVFGRNVRWFSWVALTAAAGGLAISLGAVDDYEFGTAAAVTLALYLSGYLLRLACMTRCAKVEDLDCTRRYLVQELMVALAFLLAMSAGLAFFGGEPMLDLRQGFTTFWQRYPAAVGPALLIGAIYACLFLFGTLIYLDRRENTFCVAVNRGSSILSGVVAALALAAVRGGSAPPLSQLLSAALIIVALLLLSPFHHLLEHAWMLLRGRPRRSVAVVPGSK